jgi:diphosphoinositol-polyphosphate diphosphatase
VCGLVPLNQSKTHVLLIQSARRTNWVLPKGGWETDEQTPQDAAKREAWEEAGIICTIACDLGKIRDLREPKEMTTSAPKALYHFFEAVVNKEEAEWPEKHKRGRKWMSFAEAKACLKSRPELLAALERSSITR